MIKRIILQRHGESFANVQKIFASRKIDLDLTPNGIMQIKNACKCLEMLEVKTVVTSPLKRAVQTARIISDFLDADLRVDDDLSEVNVGLFEGKDESNKEVRSNFDRVIDSWIAGIDIPFEGGECLDDVIGRINSVLDRWPRKIDENICFVSHSVFLGMLIYHLTKEADKKIIFMKRGETRILDYEET